MQTILMTSGNDSCLKKYLDCLFFYASLILYFFLYCPLSYLPKQNSDLVAPCLKCLPLLKLSRTNLNFRNVQSSPWSAFVPHLIVFAPAVMDYNFHSTICAPAKSLLRYKSVLLGQLVFVSFFCFAWVIIYLLIQMENLYSYFKNQFIFYLSGSLMKGRAGYFSVIIWHFIFSVFLCHLFSLLHV